MEANIFDYAVQLGVDTSDASASITRFSQDLVKQVQNTANIDLSQILGIQDARQMFNELTMAIEQMGGKLTATFNRNSGVLENFRLQIRDINNQIQTIDYTPLIGPQHGQQELWMFDQRTSSRTADSGTLARDQRYLVDAYNKTTEAVHKLTEAQVSGSQIEIRYRKELLAVAQQEQNATLQRFGAKYGTDQSSIVYSGVMEQISRPSETEASTEQTIRIEEARRQALEQTKNTVRDVTEAVKAYSKALQAVNADQVAGVNTGDTTTSSATAQENLRVLQERERTLRELNLVTVDAKTQLLSLNDTEIQKAQLDNTQIASIQRLVNAQNLLIASDKRKKEAQAADTAQQKEAIALLDRFVEAYKNKSKLEQQGRAYTDQYKTVAQSYADITKELEQFGIKVQENANGTVTFSSALGNLSSVTANYTDKIGRLNEGFKANVYNINESVARFIEYRVGIQALNTVVQTFTSSLGDMNKVLTQVRMVTMDSYNDTVKLAQQYGQIAQELGTTTVKVAEGADVWLNVLGHNKSL